MHYMTYIPFIFHSTFRLGCQVLFCACDVYVRNQTARHAMVLSDVHPAVWAVGLAFPVILVVINELLKHREIK